MALQLAASRDRFAMSVCGLFDIDSSLVTGVGPLDLVWTESGPGSRINWSDWVPHG